MDAIYTTLGRIRANSPCKEGFKKMIKYLGSDYGDDTPLTFRQVYESNGYEDTLWWLRTVEEKYHPLLRHFAVDCAERVLCRLNDPRSVATLEVARRYADGEATEEELRKARTDAADAEETAWAKARASRAVREYAAVRDVARETAWEATWAASYVVEARDVARARDAEEKWQMDRLFQYCRLGRRPAV